MVRRRSTVRFRNGAPAQPYFLVFNFDHKIRGQVTNYFDLKKSEGWSWGGVMAAFPGPGGAGQLARALILTRLWVNTPWPHQMDAPWPPSSRVRSQLAKAELSRRPRSAVLMTLRYRQGPSLRA